MRSLSPPFRLFLGVLLLLSFSGPLLAANVTVSWTHPTQFTDGSALALNQIASTRVEYGSCAGTAFGTVAGQVTVPAPATTTTISGFAPGTHCFRAYTRTTVAAGNQESGPSGMATKVIPFPPPNPPKPPPNICPNISPKSPNPPYPPPANGSCPPMLGSNAAWPY